MKILVPIALLIILTGCFASVRSQEFTFYDSHGKAYTSNTAALEVQNEYRLKARPKIILIATTSVYQDQFKKQMDVLSTVDPEKMQYMYVIANSNDEDHRGYYTSASSAVKLLSGEPFRIIVYDVCGEPIKFSNHVLSKAEFINYLTKASTGRQGPCRP